MIPLTPRRLPPALLAVLFSACGGGASTPSVATTVRDSAGITIVENTMDTAGARAGWAIDPTPLLTIGGLDAPEAQQLFRVSGALRLADGRIVVADGGAAEIRVYDATGALAHAHGGKGEGPGEFMAPRVAGWRGGDTVIVYDSQLRRVSVVHADRGFVRSMHVGSEGGGYPLALGTTADGGLAVGGGMFFSSDQGFPTGAVRPNSRYALLAPDGSVRADLGDVPAADMFARAGPGGFSASLLPFGRNTAAAAARDGLWLGTGDAWEVRRYARDGALTRIVRIDRPLAAVTARLRDADLAERVADAEDEDAARTMRSEFADMPARDVIPPYQLFIVDALNALWVGEYLLPGETGRTFTILDDTGRVAGRVTLPARTLPLDIGAAYVLGVTRDDLDVERLTLWRLARPAAGDATS